MSPGITIQFLPDENDAIDRLSWDVLRDLCEQVHALVCKELIALGYLKPEKLRSTGRQLFLFPGLAPFSLDDAIKVELHLTRDEESALAKLSQKLNCPEAEVISWLIRRALRLDAEVAKD